MLTSSELFNRIPSQLGDSKAEPQSDRGIEVVALEKGEGQSVIHLREHDPKIETPLWCKPPIDSGRDRVERPGALRVLGAEARGGPPGGGAEKRILDIMVTVLPSCLFAAAVRASVSCKKAIAVIRNVLKVRWRFGRSHSLFRPRSSLFFEIVSLDVGRSTDRCRRV